MSIFSPANITVIGVVGRSSTSRMLAAVATAVPDAVWPDTAIILSQGSSRGQNGTDSLAWGEALARVGNDGVVVVPATETRMRDAAMMTGATVLSFGSDPRADVKIVDVVAASTGTTFELELGSARYRVALQMLGEHLAEDAMAVLTAASAAGIDVDVAISALEELESVGPSTMHPITRADGVMLIDDTVSMHPSSVTSALKTLAMIGTEGRRTVAVLGQLDLDNAAGMTVAEESEYRREAHDRIGRIVVRLNIKRLIVIGDEARHIHNAAGLEGSWNGESVLVGSVEEAYDLLRDSLATGDAVLVKYASRPDAASTLVSRLEQSAQVTTP
ncbi:glutamate ligase domain-containing protein [Salinibacterium hongtaonis]|uniref:glutamate ligase domain-containing protein n=1 Tax=Homoserinimonas hongtaonis TaxID=2079791 RepID=UPI000D33DDEB|nr:cyanophycin synthetase [Salinibacterium hongtaonis]AWB89113.1 hypothetical protein C2138_05785 [Salinibacterium hongtaonis]